ncbi:MAG: TIGR03087 family PEP-CTERM/XrtA system glycosyltransferase [Pseudomonadota bacterium]
MKLLFVCHRLPFPPIRGGKIRPFNMIRHLHDSGHEVTVASLARSAEELEAGQGLRGHCHELLAERVTEPAAMVRMVLRLPTPVPSSMGNFYSPALARRVREALATTRFDAIVVHCSSVAQYVADAGATPRMLDFGDMDSQKWLAYSQFRGLPLAPGFWIEGTKLERAEKALARQFDLCTCTTRAELDTLDGFGTGAATGWFPNGVDSAFFKPSTQQWDPDLVTFLGRMDYYPNQEAMQRFCREVMPRVQAKRPATRLEIVGADPSPAIRRLGELPGVTVTGSVPDVRPYLERACLTVAPLSIARGTQNKILEAMGSAIPVVCSDIAAGGVDAVPGEHLLAATAAKDTADAVLSVLDDPALRERLAQAGRERVLSHHNWAHSMQRFDALLEQCVVGAAGRQVPSGSESAA